MKGFGCVAEFSRERADDLMEAYHSYISSHRYISSDIYADIVNMPAKRFYVSVERAAIAVCRILRGNTLDYMRFNKREMFFDIFQRYLLKKKESPNKSVVKLVAMVIREPAPKFYMAAGTARIIILNNKKRWYRERKRRLLHLQ